jgi:outer membrane receptor protein involved in Fe transport
MTHRIQNLLRVILLGSLLVATAYADPEAKKSYNLPTADAAESLKRFAETSGRETLFAAEVVRGVKTKPVSGNLTAQEAIAALLADTGLAYAVDEKTGAIAVRRAVDPNDARAAQNSDRPQVENGSLVLEKVEVTASRDTGLINKGVIPREEKAAINFMVLNRMEIEGTGATDINEVLRSLPQVASFESETQSLTGLRGYATFGAGVTPATKVDLRGFGVAGTTILINGRRMPLVRESQAGGPDIGRIPLSAIDRIEVLPASAGGMYGTNSMGGVVNIILRKDYSGRELTFSYGQATAGGANEVGVTYTEGRKLFGGKASLTWTIDLRDRQPMYYRERPVYNRFLEVNRPPSEGGDFLNWYDRGGFSNFPSIPGVVVAISQSNFRPEPLNIPGTTGTINYAQIPLNQDGTSLTPASFAPGANKLNPTAPYGNFALFNPSTSANFNATFTHELIKDRLNWYFELGLGHSEMEFQTPINPRVITLLPSDSRNPFRTGVTPGYPGQRINYYFYPSDLPGTLQMTKNQTVRLVLGANGKFSLLGHDWSWALDASADYNARLAKGYTPDQLLNAILASAATNLKARPFYQPFADHLSNPNPTAAAELARTSYRQNDDFVWLGSGVARLNGAVFDLPAGPVQVSLLAEYNSQWYNNVFKNRVDIALVEKYGFSYAPSGANFSLLATTADQTRATANIGTEVVVPVLSKDATLFGIHALDVSAAASRTDITDAEPFNAYNLGLRFAPIPDVALRVSYGTGTYPPLDFYTSPTTFTDIVGATTRDPLRGNTFIGDYTSIAGGNPDLQPERTNTWNFGLVIEPRLKVLKGFSATLDYGYVEKVDGITSMSLTTLLANEAYFPGRVVRGTPTSAEAALGWAGQIESADVRRFNTGNLWTQYLDTSLRYNLTTESLGSFYFTLRTTNTREYRTRLRPNVAITDTLDQIGFPLHFRGSGSVAWRYLDWVVTPSWSYIEAYRDLGNVGVDDSLTTNLQVRYDIPTRIGTNSAWRRLLLGTQITVGVNNIFDKYPPYVLNPASQSFRSFYSTFDDPRGRYVYLRIKKTY